MNKKYTKEMKEQTVVYILETGKSITSTAKELGLNINTLCRWVNDYKKEKGIISDKNQPASSEEMMRKLAETEKLIKVKDKEIQKREKEIADREESIEILKKSLRIFMEPHE